MSLVQGSGKVPATLSEKTREIGLIQLADLALARIFSAMTAISSYNS
jgi:hypothetical protein